MTLLLAAVLAVPSLLFAAWPLVRRRAGTELAPADEQAELLADKQLALRALRELELDHQSGHLTDDDYAELRTRDEARAAAILRRLDALAPSGPSAKTRRPGPDAPPGAATGPWTRQPAVLAAGAVGLLVFGVALGVLVTRFTTPDTQALPGPMAGSFREPAGLPAAGAGDGGAPGQPLPPEVLQGMLQAAHQSLDGGRYPEAMSAYRAILTRDPRNVEAITHLGIILALAGHNDEAVEAFNRALAIDPRYAHALWDLANLLHDVKRDYAGAARTWERFLAVAAPGSDREHAQRRLADARARAQGASPTPSGGTRPAQPPAKP